MSQFEQEVLTLLRHIAEGVERLAPKTTDQIAAELAFELSRMSGSVCLPDIHDDI